MINRISKMPWCKNSFLRYGCVNLIFFIANTVLHHNLFRSSTRSSPRQSARTRADLLTDWIRVRFIRYFSYIRRVDRGCARSTNKSASDNNVLSRWRRVRRSAEEPVVRFLCSDFLLVTRGLFIPLCVPCNTFYLFFGTRSVLPMVRTKVTLMS